MPSQLSFLPHFSSPSLKARGPRAHFLVLFSCLSSLGFTQSYGFNCHLYVNGFPIYISCFIQDKYTKLPTWNSTRMLYQTGEAQLCFAKDDLESQRHITKRFISHSHYLSSTVWTSHHHSRIQADGAALIWNIADHSVRENRKHSKP